MSTTETGNSQADLNEKLAAYRQLAEERQTFEARIERAKAEKDSVNERVFQKVLSGYEDALKDAIERLAPV